jgi:type I restriction enzyme, S subunit
MSDWKKTTLGDIACKNRTGIVDGPFGSNLPASDYTSSGIPVIRGVNLSLGKERFRDSNYVFVSEKTANRLNRSLCSCGDIIFTKKGTLGQTGIVPSLENNKSFLISSNQMKLSVDKSLANSLFVYYYVSSPSSRDRILSDAMTTGVPKINLGYLRKFPIILPPLSIQQKIAAIVSAYDDLIENDDRRIALLEKMAEEIYREWFVRLRFPGHEQVTFHKGIPEGWEMVKIAKAFDMTGGGTPSKDESRYWTDGEINWYTPSDITASNGIFLFNSGLQCAKEGLNSSSARLFPSHSIMMTSRATIGAIGINTTPACTNQGFITCIPNENYPLIFLYHWLKLNKGYFEILATGSTFAELSKSTFKKMSILTPDKELINRFNDKVLPMFQSIEILLKEVTNLKQTRDRLLTRLISGKLSVEDLDIQFPPSMTETVEATHDG